MFRKLGRSIQFHLTERSSLDFNRSNTSFRDFFLLLSGFIKETSMPHLEGGGGLQERSPEGLRKTEIE
jgi:hypothetical protein